MVFPRKLLQLCSDPLECNTSAHYGKVSLCSSVLTTSSRESYYFSAQLRSGEIRSSPRLHSWDLVRGRTQLNGSFCQGRKDIFHLNRNRNFVFLGLLRGGVFPGWRFFMVFRFQFLSLDKFRVWLDYVLKVQRKQERGREMRRERQIDRQKNLHFIYNWIWFLKFFHRTHSLNFCCI